MKNEWVLLRGLARGNEHWADFPQELKNKSPQIQVDLQEIPGNGSRNNEKTPVEVLKIIEQARARCPFVKSGKKFNICAISLGAMIALKWAEIYPEEIESLVVINTSLPQLSTSTERLRPSTYAQVLSALLKQSSMKREKIILGLTSNNPLLIEKNLARFVAFANKHPVSILNFLRQLLLAQKIQLTAKPKVPIKVICSKNDRLVNYKCSLRIATWLDVTPVIHLSAGHDLPLDDANWLINQLLEN